jgi:Ca2+-binding RTX toxin-like protein
MLLQFRGRVGTGQQILDGDLRDLQILTLNGGIYLYTTTGVGGGLSGYALQEGQLADWENSLYYSGISPELISGSLAALSSGGEDLLVFGGTGTLQAVRLNDTGRITARVETGSMVSGTETVSAMVTVSLQSGMAVYVADDGTGTLTTYAGSGSDLQRQSGTGSPGLSGAVAMASVTVSDTTYVLAADQGTQGVSSFRVDMQTGALSATDMMGANQGLGVATPTAMEVVQAHGATWVVLAAADSNSLSVMQLSSTGELIATDHVIDTLQTRFEGVQSLAAVEVDGQVFIVAGGADDGLSLFTLLPDGRLVHLQTIAHWGGLGLMDVGQIAARQVGDEIQVFVSSDDQAGLSQFTLSLADLGQVLWNGMAGSSGDDLMVASGEETLRGWDGDDILVAGYGDTVMTGGAGADLFVMRTGGHSATITDFDPANDRLDLSDWPMLRDPAQLTLTPTRWGAVITYRDNTLTIQTASGQPLTSIGTQFDGPDRVLVLGQVVGRSLSGTRGADILAGDDGNDTIDAGGGHDEIWTRDGDDLIYAGWGHDLVGAGHGEDTIWAADGEDSIYGDAGNDVIGGGAGRDQLWGGEGNDLIYGDVEEDTLGGAAGNDTLWAGDGRDVVFGDLGDDEMGGGIGADQVWAGAGDDLAYGGDGWDSLGGGTGNDTIWADSGNDIVFGGEGNDVLAGSWGNDTIWAGPGRDTVYGGGDHDLLGGGLGRDTLFGGRGNDTLSGGTHEDTFVFVPNDGADIITDFTPGEDRIRLTAGVTGFGDLTLDATADGVRVGYGTGTILLEGLTVTDLGASDFLFG